MTTSLSICLFHDRRYSSNIQHILNLLRRNILKIKCDLNFIGKKSLCTCKLSSNQLIITDEELNEKQKEFEKLNLYQWTKEIDQIIQFKILNTCDSKISFYKLFKLICDISNENNFLKMIKTIQKDGKRLHNRSRHSNLIRRQLELSISSNQISYLLGRNGHRHKQIMKDTKTRIHFDNAPYSIKLRSMKCPEFNLDVFQSSCSIKATITGHTMDDVENATKALQELDRVTKINVSRLYEN